MTTFETIARAARPEEVFGRVADAADLKRKFHALARKVHPDLHKGQRRAQDAFAKLAGLAEEAERRLAAGVYGTAASSPAPAAGPTVIERGRARYVVGDALPDADLCGVYRAERADGASTQRVVVKVAAAMDDNDLVAREAEALRALISPTAPPDADLHARARGGAKLSTDERRTLYLPRLVDSFRLPDPAHGPRQVNVLRDEDEYASFLAVRTAYPAGLVLEDAVWMSNRLFEGLGYVHQRGWVHGAVLPPHVLVLPSYHGAKIIDWSYSTCDERVPAVASRWRAFYAPEIVNRQRATPATDIYMAARCLAYVLGASHGGPPPSLIRADASGKEAAAAWFVGFLRKCLSNDPRDRPQDAWDARAEVDHNMRSLFGPRKFHKFEMPR